MGGRAAWRQGDYIEPAGQPLIAVFFQGFWTNAGTSRSLTVTYLRPAVLGDDVIMECEVSYSLLKLFLALEVEGENVMWRADG